MGALSTHLIDLNCETFVVQCSTYCFRREHGNAYCGRALSAKPKSLPSVIVERERFSFTAVHIHLKS